MIQSPIHATKVIISKICPMCEKTHTVEVDRQKYEQWHSGKLLVQEAFPELTPDQREILQTGIDGECWKRLWADEDECDD